MATRMLKLVEVEPEGPSWVSRLQAAIRSFWVGPRSTRDPELAKLLFGENYRTTAGIAVTPENAFTFSAVYNAVLQISNDIAKLPLNLKKRRQDGGSEDYVASSLYNLLKIEPNPEMGSMDLRRTITAHALTCHGGYAEIERDGTGRPVNLWVLTPDRVQPIREKRRNAQGNEEYGPLKYKIDGGKTVLDAMDVLHIRGLGYDGYSAYPVIDKARQAIGLALAAERFGAAFFGNGSTFGGILSTEMDLDEETAKAQIEVIEKYHQSADKAHRLLALPGGWKFSQTGVEPQKAQMNELRDRQVMEVARFFRMPPYRLGVNTPGTVSYASVEMANLDYYTGAMLDWMTTWEQELNRKLIPRLERRQQFVKHNANAFLRADIKTRYESYGMMLDRGVFCADDVLELEDMNPQPDGLGKIYLVQGAQVPKDKVIAIAESNIKKNETPPPAPNPPTPSPVDDEADRAIREAITALTQRAEEAERLVAEARASYETERVARAEAEGRLGANAAELEALRTSEAESLRRVGLAEAIAAERRAEAEQAIEAKAAADEARATAEAEVARAKASEVAAVTASEQASAAATAAETERAAWEAKASEAIEKTAAAHAEVLEAQRQVTESQELLASVKAELKAANEATAAAEEARFSAAAELLTATTDRDAVRQQVAEADQAFQSARAKAESLEADLEAAKTVVSEAEDKATRWATLFDEISAERDAAIEARDAATAKVAEIDAARVEGERREAMARESEASRHAAVLSSHRALIVDVMRRMIDRECDRMRRAQQSPEKLSQAIETFYAGHEELCQTALLPAIRVHLAWTGSTEDPVALTRRLVAQHVEQSIRQLRTVLDGDAGELAVSVTTLLRQWETERVDQIADVVLQRGIDYARGSHS